MALPKEDVDFLVDFKSRLETVEEVTEEELLTLDRIVAWLKKHNETWFPSAVALIPPGGTTPDPGKLITVFDSGTVLQVNGMLIAAKLDGGRVVLDQENWNKTVVTRKFLKMFLEETTVETQEKINSGRYEVMVMNPYITTVK